MAYLQETVTKILSSVARHQNKALLAPVKVQLSAQESCNRLAALPPRANMT
jgi:hypothetical protein